MKNLKIKCNLRESKILTRLLKKGFEVYHRGFPDFLAYQEETNTLIFVEVKRKQRRKTHKMGLTVYQRRVIEILKKFHKVYVVYVD